MEIRQTKRFEKVYKKLHKNQLPDVNKAIKTIIDNPAIGELKHGDLAGLRVHKFMVYNQLMLLGYVIQDDCLILTLADLGTHENFYRDLKKAGGTFLAKLIKEEEEDTYNKKKTKQ